MTKTIPAQSIFICDACNKEGQNCKMQTVISINRHALDYLGDASANGSSKIELCDNCAVFIFKCINDSVEALKDINKRVVA